MCGSYTASALSWGFINEAPRDSAMYAILRGANGRRHEVDFGDDPVVVNVAMSDITVQITMTASDDLNSD